jgi:hypothetical protein
MLGLRRLRGNRWQDRSVKVGPIKHAAPHVILDIHKIPFGPRKSPYCKTGLFRLILFLYSNTLVVGQYMMGYEGNFDIKFLSSWGQILIQLWANYAFFYNLCISDDHKPFTFHWKILAALYSVTYSF